MVGIFNLFPLQQAGALPAPPPPVPTGPSLWTRLRAPGLMLDVGGGLAVPSNFQLQAADFNGKPTDFKTFGGDFDVAFGWRWLADGHLVGISGGYARHFRPLQPVGSSSHPETLSTSRDYFLARLVWWPRLKVPLYLSAAFLAGSESLSGTANVGGPALWGFEDGKNHSFTRLGGEFEFGVDAGVARVGLVGFGVSGPTSTIDNQSKVGDTTETVQIAGNSEYRYMLRLTVQLGSPVMMLADYIKKRRSQP